MTPTKEQIEAAVETWFGDPGKWESKQILGKVELCGFAEYVAESVMLQWISVEDALPGEADANPDYPRNSLPFQVIAQTGQNIAVFHYASREWLQKGTSIFIPNVTHWQPLPEPPQQ